MAFPNDTQAEGLDTLSNQMPSMQQPVSFGQGAPEQIPPYKPAPATPIPPEAAPAARPGSFGWKLANTLKGFTAAMGDAGAVGQVPEGAGALYGAQKALQARTQRLKEEQAHKEVLEQQARENSREDWRMMANVAQANSQMRHEQALTWQLGEEQMDKSIANGSQIAEQWSSLPKAQSQVLAENLTAGEINQAIQQKGPDGKPRLDPTKSTAFPTGKKYVGEDRQGRPQYALTYTVMSVPAEYQLTPADKSWIDVVNQIPGGQKYNVGAKPGEGDRMPGYVANSLYKQAQTILAQTAARNKLAADQNFENEYVNFDTTGQWAKYLSAQKGDIQSAVDHFLADWRKDPKLQQQFPQLLKDIQRSFGTKEDPTGTTGYTNALKEQQRQKEKDREDEERRLHDINMEEIDRKKAVVQNAAKNKYLGDPELLEKYRTSHNAADLDAYKQSFPLGEMDTVDAIGGGRADIGSMSYLLSRNSNLADAVNVFYPDFNNLKVKGFAGVVEDYAYKKSGISLRSAGIALRHMYRLYNDTTDWSRLDPTTRKERTADYDQLVQELARYNAGSNAPNKEEIDSAKEQLGGDQFYSVARRAAIKRNAELIGDGLKEFKRRWDVAAPSKNYALQYPGVSYDARASQALVEGDGTYKVNLPNGRIGTFADVKSLAKFFEAVDQANGMKPVNLDDVADTLKSVKGAETVKAAGVGE